MSDATQDLQGTASHPSGDDYKGPVAEPTESYDSEIALNGSRDLLRAGSTVFAGIRKAIEFHTGEGDRPGASAQCVREVLGTIERAAAEASKHQPKWRKSNGMPEFAEWNPPALRQLAALCRVYAGVDEVTLAEPVAPTAEPVAPTAEQVAESIAEHERQVIAERGEPRTGGIIPEPVLAANGAPERVEMVVPDAGTVTPVDTWPANIITPLPNGATLITGPPDPFTAPAPLDPTWLDGYTMPLPFVAEVATEPNAGSSAYADPFSNPAPVGHGPAGVDDGIPF